jgi:hypothetical protein
MNLPPGRRLRLLFQAAAIALALAGAVAPLPAGAVDKYFSAGLYPSIQHILTPLTNSFSWAVLDLLVAAALIAIAVTTGRAVRAAWGTRRLTPLLGAGWRFIVAGAVAYLAFLLVWGLNYRRLPIADHLEVGPDLPQDAAVMSLGRQAVAQVNGLYGRTQTRRWTEPELDADLRRAFEEVQSSLSDAPLAVPGRLKRTALGPYFRWATVDGMINPFGLEVLANPDLLPFERPFVAAHEWSHLAGYADEAEASFVGWLTCVRADVASQYSGWLYLYWQVSGEVGSAARAELAGLLGEGPRRDIDLMVARLQRGQLPWLRSASWRVYDQYLKANRVDEGIRSYGVVVTLILRTRFEEGWKPVRRKLE